MTQIDNIWWEQMRTKGRGWFVFREGILHYGTLGGFWLTLFGAVFFLIGNGSLPPLLGLIVSWALSAICLGPFIGFVLWNQHEKDYQKQKGTDHEG